MPAAFRVPYRRRARERLIAPVWRLYRHLETDLHRLQYFFWEATLRCNLACRHCGSDCHQEAQGKELETAQVLQVFQEVAKAYDPSRIIVVVTGGEPLLRPDLLPTMASLRQLGFSWGMVTNGWLVTPEVARACKQAGLYSVVVSLDGPPEAHEWLRRRKGSFHRAMEALRNLKQAGIPLVEAVTCVHQGNLHLLQETYQLIRSTGATHWRLFNIFPKGRALREPDLLLSPAGLRRLVVEVVNLRAQAARDGMTVNFSDEGYFHPALDTQMRSARFFCRAGINIAGLLADGSVTACPNLHRDLIQGNVLERSFVDIWENSYQKFRDRTWLRRGICQDCDRWDDCQGNALHGYNWEKGEPSRCHYRETLPLVTGTLEV